MNRMKTWLHGVALAVPALVLASGLAVAGGQDVWKARLSGDNEAPPVASKAHGSATFTVIYDLTTEGDTTGINRIEYQVRVSSLVDVRAAHIHIGAPGVAGPIAVNLNATQSDGRTNGVIAQGTFMANDLTGPLAGLTLSDLYDEFVAGNAYVNVHTVAHPGGEIRGTLNKRGGPN